MSSVNDCSVQPTAVLPRTSLRSVTETAASYVSRWRTAAFLHGELCFVRLDEMNHVPKPISAPVGFVCLQMESKNIHFSEFLWHELI